MECTSTSVLPNHVARAELWRTAADDRLVGGAVDSDAAQQAAYTFDAGPNAVIYVRREHVAHVLAVLLNHFPAADDSAIVTPRADLVASVRATPVPASLVCDADRVLHGAIGHIYHTSVR